MEVSYKKTFLDEEVSFRFNGWFKIRKENLKITRILWVKNNRMMFDKGIYNSRTPIMFFLN